MEPFLGEIRAFAFGYAPRGWLLCNGVLLAINTNQALFALLGTRYGGNGTTTFALPNLCGRTPVGYDSNMPIGMVTGTESVTLISTQIPQHTHQVMCTTATATTNIPAGHAMAQTNASLLAYANTGDAQMADSAIAPSGSNQPHQNMQPSLVINWCIASSGIFPPRN